MELRVPQEGCSTKKEQGGYVAERFCLGGGWSARISRRHTHTPPSNKERANREGDCFPAAGERGRTNAQRILARRQVVMLAGCV